MFERLTKVKRGPVRLLNLKPMAKLFLLGGFVLALTSCTLDRPPSYPISDSPHNYNLNGNYDDNGVEPPPNNGNQNFGHRW